MYVCISKQPLRPCVPGGEGQDISALHFGAAQQNLVQNLILEQLHGGPPLRHVPPLLDGVGHITVPPAVVLQSPMPEEEEQEKKLATYRVHQQ